MALDLAKLRAIRAGLPDAVAAGREQGAEYIKDLASQFAPKDEGDLSESGAVTPQGEGQFQVSFGNGLPDIRAIVQELGSVDQPAQPYLGPAASEINVELEVAKKIQELL